MPVIVIGADTSLGAPIIDALLARDGEVRAFVSEEAAAERLKALHVKVALGDVSDTGHVGAAAMRCFTAVVLDEAARDERERSFAPDAKSVVRGWVEAIKEAQVRRVIWVGSDPPATVPAEEYAPIDPTGQGAEAIAARVAELDDAAAL